MFEKPPILNGDDCLYQVRGDLAGAQAAAVDIAECRQVAARSVEQDDAWPTRLFGDRREPVGRWQIPGEPGQRDTADHHAPDRQYEAPLGQPQDGGA